MGRHQSQGGFTPEEKSLRYQLSRRTVGSQSRSGHFGDVDTCLDDVDTSLDDVYTFLDDVDTSLDDVYTSLDDVDTSLDDVDTSLDPVRNPTTILRSSSP